MAGVGSGTGRAAGCGASGLPVQEVAVQGQAVLGALLGVELGGENVIACHGAGKARAVVGFARRCGAGRTAAHRSCARSRSRRRRARPAQIGCGRACEHLVPAHLRHLVAAAVGLQPAFEAEAQHLAGDQAQAAACPALRCGRAASACPRTRPSAACCAAASSTASCRPESRSSRMQSRHRALARQHDALGGAAPLRAADVTITSKPLPCGHMHAPPATPSAGCPCRSRRRRRCVPSQVLQAALGRRDDAGRARVERQRHAQRAREGLEHRLALVVRVVALQVVDVQRDAARGWRSPGRTRRPAGCRSRRSCRP